MKKESRSLSFDKRMERLFNLTHHKKSIFPLTFFSPYGHVSFPACFL